MRDSLLQNMTRGLNKHRKKSLMSIMPLHKYLINIFLVLACLLTGCITGYSTGQVNNDTQLKEEIRRSVERYTLPLPAWEIANFLGPPGANSQNSQGSVDLAGLQENIAKMLKEEDINVFPPLRVRLESPPLLLVISPRQKIAYFDRLLLLPGLTAEEIEEVENSPGRLNLSSLVVKLGGFGAAYPAIVSPQMPEKQVINAAVEEWAHQYLAFKPLGFLYLLDSLGFSQEPAVITMNETLAGMIAEEIGHKIYQRYYMDTLEADASQSMEGFDFDIEMSQTRHKVDELLASGNIDGAENYMQSRRLFFNQHGYGIRKLNQAYFAFHGIYGQDPAAASPVYQDMKIMRKAFPSLSQFVAQVSAMTGYAQLEDAVRLLSNETLPVPQP